MSSLPITPFSYYTWAQAISALALRLNDVGNVMWSQDELGAYLTYALRFWNVCTQYWVNDWTATYTDTDLTWQSTGPSSNSFVGTNETPRSQSLSSIDLFTIVESMLMEPATGGTWTGTKMFTIDDLSQALQRRRDELLQNAATYVGPFSSTFGMPTGSARVFLPDSTSQSILDLQRIRLVPDPSIPGVKAQTLYREDGLAYEYFENDFTSAPSDQIPFAWGVLAGPPLAITLDVPAPFPNTLDILAMISGGLISDATATSPLLIPNDFSWVLMFGILADVLNKENESTDRARAAYAEQRFEEGLKLMMQMPWMLQARLNNLPVDTPSVAEMDDFEREWEDNPDAMPAIVRGGIDLFAISPPAPVNSSIAVTLSLVANAPIPATDNDFIQVPRDILDAIIDEAQHIATFKLGSLDLQETMILHQNFIATCKLYGRRQVLEGIFPTDLRPVGDAKQEQLEPRFALAEES